MVVTATPCSMGGGSYNDPLQHGRWLLQRPPAVWKVAECRMPRHCFIDMFELTFVCENVAALALREEDGIVKLRCLIEKTP